MVARPRRHTRTTAKLRRRGGGAEAQTAVRWERTKKKKKRKLTSTLECVTSGIVANFSPTPPNVDLVEHNLVNLGVDPPVELMELDVFGQNKKLNLDLNPQFGSGSYPK